MAEEKEEQQRADETEAGEKQKKGKLKLILLVVIPVVLLGGLGATYFLYGDAIIKQYFADTIVEKYLGRNTEEETPAKKKETNVGPIMTLDPFVFNLSGNTSRYAKVSLAIGLKDAKALEEAKKIMPALRDKALAVMSGKTPEVLIDVRSRDSIKQELYNSLKGVLKDGDLHSVYITDIIIT